MAGSVAGCDDRDMVLLLRQLYDKNISGNWDQALHDKNNGCFSDPNATQRPHPTNFHWGADHSQIGLEVYAYVTPFIILVGLIGNGVSMAVFASRALRKLSASLYLAAISLSDTMVLLTYVLLDWLNRGLRQWPGEPQLPVVNVFGVCQSFLYFSYLFRFVSVWVLVVFTMERYIAACRPLHRRIICTKTFGRRAILTICGVASLISLYKPLLSGLFQPRSVQDDSTFGLYAPTNSQYDQPKPQNATLAGDMTQEICTRNPDYPRTNFTMEVIYGLLITAVPFVIIAVFNMLILRTIMQRDANIRKFKIAFKDNRIRWEFTVTLLAVSSSFICLNLPYFVTWCQQFRQTTNASVSSQMRDQLYITRTIFYLNYCVNFFLYCLSGTYYRRQLAKTFGCRTDGAVLNGTSRKFSSSGMTNTTHVTNKLYDLTVLK